MLERFRRPKEILMARGPQGLWKITQENRLIFFNQDRGNPLHEWKREEFMHLLVGFVDTLYELRREKPEYEQMVLEALRVEWPVALGFYINSDLTLDHLESSTEDTENKVIRVPNFLPDGLRLDITNQQYYDTWELLVTGHPNGDRIVRHIPDALAITAKEVTI